MFWDPTTEEEILQNVQSLTVVAQGTQSFARALGMPIQLLDGPEQVAAARIGAALNTQIRTYEPRATVARIIMARDGNGQLRPTVRLA
mgnify:CR=1 FL=1